MKYMSKDYLRRHLPPHSDADKVFNLICIVLFCSAGLGFIIFLCRYGSSYGNLFGYFDGRRILLEGVFMLPFYSFAKGIFVVNVWGIIYALGYSVQLYSSFFSKSQSIYLMRRLPDNRKTLRHMVFDVPLRWALCTLILSLLSVAAAYIIWRFVTPAVCLPI